VPVTIKIRAGWSAAEVNAPAYAAMAEAEGVRAVTVHGRTREQMFTGRADREVIRRTVEAVSIPVIGNGDVDGPEAAAWMLDETGCAAVMIGRAAQGNPWIFGEILETWRTGVRPDPPSPAERFSVIRRHLGLHVDHAGPESAVREMRKHVCWYTKGLPEGARFRNEVNAVTTLPALEDALARYFEALDQPRALAAV
jgi:tRNA-dihydrouridine synthase B